MKGRPIPYSPAELAWLSANRTLVIGDYHAQFCARFGRTDVSGQALHALRKRKGWRTGRVGWWAPGVVPHNKGKKCPQGTGGRHPNAVATQFRPGTLQGAANANYKPVGTERMSADGYLERKVSDIGPARIRWRGVHRINWEALHGPIPEGLVLKCKGDKANPHPDNWDLVPRGVLARLNGGRWGKRVAYATAPEPVKPAIMALARLEQELCEARRGGTA